MACGTALLIAVAGCGGSAQDSSATDLPASETSQEDTAAVDNAAEGTETVTPSPSVDMQTGDVVAYTKIAQQVITDLLGQGIRAQGGGMCAIAVGVVLDSAGPTVAMMMPGQEDIVSRFVPAQINGSELPCVVEVVFEDVSIPNDATVITFSSRGGSSPYTKETATTTGKELIRNGFTVELS